MVQSEARKSNALHDLGYKIFLDRYAQKDMTRSTLTVGDTVIVVVDSKTGQREVGKITEMKLPKITIELLDGTVVERDIENVDKPIEVDPSQMMDRVAMGVAEVEATPELQAQWAERFRWLLDDWKFVPAGRILAAAGTDQELTYYNCMPPEQEVLTAEGYKPIAEIKLGDLVVTHRNRLRPVLHKFERETEELIYVIKPKKMNFDDLRVTGDHKVHVIRSEWVNKHRSRDGLHLKNVPDWVPAKELKPGDYVAVAYNDEECPVEAIRLSDYLEESYEVVDGKVFKSTVRSQYRGQVSKWGTHYSIHDELIVDADLCYLFGRWLGDGCVTHRTGTDIPSGIKIVFSLEEKAEGEEIGRIIEEKFGITPALKLSSTERWYDLWVNSMPIGQFFKAFLGYYSYGKRIPEELMHLPKELTLELLRGLFSADGYISGNKLGIVLSNRVLSTQVHQLLLRLGYLFSIRENTHRLGRVPAYRVQATSNECGPLFERFFGVQAPQHDVDLKYYLEYDGLKWLRIDEIAVEDYSGIVMDIEVEEDHSFISAGVVVSNCYVIPSPRDSRGGIIETLRQMTEIMSRGGGVGINISSLRPRHSYVKGVNGRSSGAVSWGALYSFVTGLIEQGGSRRGALMLILNDWHPDVFDFINSKRTAGQITNANISVGVSDKLMDAVKADGDWQLMFPDSSDPDYDELWDGDLEKWIANGHKSIEYRTVKARDVWNAIIESAWASAEPGVWFRERANKMSNSFYYNEGYLIATNPCGEQSLPGYAVCNLGAINLARFYDEDKHDVEWDKLEWTARYATRFLDNIIDNTPYFFEENRKQQLGERRVGLNNMGLAELLIKLGIRYGSDESVAFIDKLYSFLARAIYDTSIELAQEKGAFPQFDAEKFVQSGYMQSMPEDIRAKVQKYGIRNVTLTTQAPTGTTGTMVNTSTGIEPFFSWVYYRKSRLGLHEEQVPLVKEWREQHPGEDELPDYFVTAMDLAPEEHVKVQAAIQRWVDSSISKTCNVPNEYTVEQVSDLYKLMYDLGCKGGTIYRDGSRDEQVLMLKPEDEKKPAVNGSNGNGKVEQVSTPHKVYPRPKQLSGVTVSRKTPFGTAYITMNSDENNCPFEVFITVGKAGSDLQADAEGLGRMISLQLRTTAPQNRMDMLKLIIEQLQGIGGARAIGFGPQRVLSLPDVVAQALNERYFPPPSAQQLDLPINGGTFSAPQKAVPISESDNHVHTDGAIKGADICPQCQNVALVQAEGCSICLSCGFSQC